MLHGIWISSREQLKRVAQIVKKQAGKVHLQIQHCFSPLLALANDNKLWGNANTGIYKGCTAGIASCAINVNGEYIPCRHLDIPEKYEKLEDYWFHSTYLNQLREMNKDSREICTSCRFARFCRHCQASNWSLHRGFFLGRDQCEIFEQSIRR